MTIICFDGKTLAADRQVSSGDTKATMTKLFKVPGGILGIAGVVSDALEFVDWASKGRIVADYPASLRGGESFTVLFVDNKKNIFEYVNSPFGIAVKDKRYAVGSGAAGALVALELGKNAADAVKIVSKFYIDCGMGVDTLTLEGK